MFGLKTVERHELIALRFNDDEEFRRAARLAAFSRIAVDVPGQDTLIVRIGDVKLFKGLKYVTEPIADKISDAERSSLRRRIR